MELINQNGLASPSAGTSKVANAYIDSLTTLPLEVLESEPSAVASEATAVENDLINLCYREFSTFVSIHQCSSAVRSAFDDFDLSLQRLHDSVPQLEGECQNFSTKTHRVQRVRRQAALIQEHQSKILEIIEIPQIMETCVRTGHYQEAMELAGHARTLAAEFKQNGLLQDIANEVDLVEQHMVIQLLTALRQGSNLPTLLKAVAHLRRLNCMTEDELAVVYLISRAHNFRQHLSQIDSERADSLRYLRRYIDTFREHVYDIISQYMALFADPVLITTFAREHIAELARKVATSLSNISGDSASLSSLLLQLGYCALSFARLGADFEWLVVNGILDSVGEVYLRSTTSASSSLATSLRAALNEDNDDPANMLMPEADLPTRALPSDESFDGAFAALNTLPILARFVNSHFGALNSLRLFAPLELSAKFIDSLSKSLTTSTSTLLDFVEQAVRRSAALSDSPDSPQLSSRSPRARLKRRNTETQMSLETKEARRRRSEHICVFACRVWHQTVNYLLQGLQQRVLQQSDVIVPVDLRRALNSLDTWANEHDAASLPAPAEPIGGVPVDIQPTQQPEPEPSPPPDREDQHPRDSSTLESQSAEDTQPATAADVDPDPAGHDGVSESSGIKEITVPENALPPAALPVSQATMLESQIPVDVDDGVGEAKTEDTTPLDDSPMPEENDVTSSPNPSQSGDQERHGVHIESQEEATESIDASDANGGLHVEQEAAHKAFEDDVTKAQDNAVGIKPPSKPKKKKKGKR